MADSFRKTYWPYLGYVVRHKWYVGVACAKAGLWREAILHDLSKLLPDEFGPYARNFYGCEAAEALREGARLKGYYHKPGANSEFDAAWLRHQHRNPHHWQHWLLVQDDDPTMALEMPRRKAVEMVCDWRGAGKAQGHGDDLRPWYNEHRGKMVLASQTRTLVDALVKWR